MRLKRIQNIARDDPPVVEIPAAMLAQYRSILRAERNSEILVLLSQRDGGAQKLKEATRVLQNNVHCPLQSSSASQMFP